MADGAAPSQDGRMFARSSLIVLILLVVVGAAVLWVLGGAGTEPALRGREAGEGEERSVSTAATLATEADEVAGSGEGAPGAREGVLDAMSAAGPRLVVRVFLPSGEQAGHVTGFVLDADGAALGGKHPSLFESYIPESPIEFDRDGELVFSERTVAEGDGQRELREARWVVVRAPRYAPVVAAVPRGPWSDAVVLDVKLEQQRAAIELTLDTRLADDLEHRPMGPGMPRQPNEDPWWGGPQRLEEILDGVTAEPYWRVEVPEGGTPHPRWLEAGALDRMVRGLSMLSVSDEAGLWQGLLFHPELFGTSVFEGPPVAPDREGRADFLAATLEPGAPALRLVFDPSVALAVPAPPDSLAEAPRPDAVMGVVLETGLALSHIAFEFGEGADFGVLPKELRLLDQRVERVDLAGCAAAAFGRRGDGRLVCLGPASGLGSLATSALTQRAANAQETLVRFVGPSGAPMILSKAVRVGNLPGTRIMLEPVGEEDPTGYRFTAACGRPHRIVVPWGAFKVVREVAVGATDVRIELAPLGRLEVVAEDLPPVFEAMTQSVRVTSLESGWTESFISYTAASGMDLPPGDYVVELDNPHVFEVPGSRFAPQRVTIASEMTTTVRF